MTMIVVDSLVMDGGPLTGAARAFSTINININNYYTL
jgi:hypothetical protein